MLTYADVCSLLRGPLAPPPTGKMKTGPFICKFFNQYKSVARLVEEIEKEKCVTCHVSRICFFLKVFVVYYRKARTRGEEVKMCRCLMDKELLILRFFFWRATLSSVVIITTQTQDCKYTRDCQACVFCAPSAPPLVLCPSSGPLASLRTLFSRGAPHKCI